MRLCANTRHGRATVLENITEKLNALIADVDQMRTSVGRRKAALLKETPTESGMNELVSLNRSLEGLQLAEDLLSDAVKAIETKAA